MNISSGAQKTAKRSATKKMMKKGNVLERRFLFCVKKNG